MRRGTKSSRRGVAARQKKPELPNTVEDLDKAILDVLQTIEDDFIRANTAVSTMIRDARPFVRNTQGALETLEPLAKFLQSFASEPHDDYLKRRFNTNGTVDDESIGAGPIAEDIGATGAALGSSTLGAASMPSSAAAAGSSKQPETPSQAPMEGSVSSDPATPSAQVTRRHAAATPRSGRSQGASAGSSSAMEGDAELEDALLREPAAPAFRTVVPHTPAVLKAREHLARSAIGTPLHGSKRRKSRGGAGAGFATPAPPGAYDAEADGPLGLFSPPVTTPFLRASMKPPRSSMRRRTGTGRKAAASGRKASRAPEGQGPGEQANEGNDETGNEDDDDAVGIVDDSDEEGGGGALLGFVDEEDDLGLRASVLAGPLDFAELDGVRGAASGAGAGDSDGDDVGDDDDDDVLASPELPKFSKRATMLIRKSMAPAGMGQGPLLEEEEHEDEEEDEEGNTDAGGKVESKPSAASAAQERRLQDDDGGGGFVGSDSDEEEAGSAARGAGDFSLDLFPSQFQSGAGAVQLAAVWSHFAAESTSDERPSSTAAQISDSLDGLSEPVARLLLGLLVGRGFVRASNVGGEVFYRLR